jgi:type IV secretion system protein VirB5
MPRSKIAVLGLTALATFGAVSGAQAAWPVIDIGAIAQLILQLQTLKEQLTTAQDELHSITGGRGMERLLAGTVRNYLPVDWNQVAGLLQGTAGNFGVLAASVERLVNAQAVLSAAELAALSAIEREELEAARRSAATLQVIAREALATTSARFDSIQELVNAIAGAEDQKAILDLQARISAEQGMLQNEQTKLQVLYQTLQAEEWARRQRVREQAILDVGSLRTLPAMGL